MGPMELDGIKFLGLWAHSTSDSGMMYEYIAMYEL